MFDLFIFDLNTTMISIWFMSRPKKSTYYFDFISYNYFFIEFLE